MLGLHMVAYIVLAAVGKLPAHRAHELVGEHVLDDQFIQVFIARHLF